MANNKIKLTISTPNGIFFSDFIDILTIKLPNGYKGVQKNILPFMSNIEISSMFLNKKGSSDYKIFAIGGGLIYAEREYIDIFTDDIENKNDLNENDLNKIIKTTEKLLKKDLNMVEQTKNELLLLKTLNKIQTLKIK
ncbi:MAG: F0F1 ATP synthase subunit epsilon [Metamycoplasmataceae bacterium]